MAVTSNYDLGFEVPGGGIGFETRNTFYVGVRHTASAGTLRVLFPFPPPFETARCSTHYGILAGQLQIEVSQVFSPAVT